MFNVHEYWISRQWARLPVESCGWGLAGSRRGTPAAEFLRDLGFAVHCWGEAAPPQMPQQAREDIAVGDALPRLAAPGCGRLRCALCISISNAAAVASRPVRLAGIHLAAYKPSGQHPVLPNPCAPPAPLAPAPAACLGHAAAARASMSTATTFCPCNIWGHARASA